MAQQLLKDLESGALTCCVVNKTVKAAQCLDTVTGSIRRGLRFPENQKLKIDSYAQHLASVECKAVNKAHAKRVATLGWKTKVAEVHRRRFDV